MKANAVQDWDGSAEELDLNALVEIDHSFTSSPEHVSCSFDDIYSGRYANESTISLDSQLDDILPFMESDDDDVLDFRPSLRRSSTPVRAIPSTSVELDCSEVEMNAAYGFLQLTPNQSRIDEVGFTEIEQEDNEPCEIQAIPVFEPISIQLFPNSNRYSSISDDFIANIARENDQQSVYGSLYNSNASIYYRNSSSQEDEDSTNSSQCNLHPSNQSITSMTPNLISSPILSSYNANVSQCDVDVLGEVIDPFLVCYEQMPPFPF